MQLEILRLVLRALANWYSVQVMLHLMLFLLDLELGGLGSVIVKAQKYREKQHSFDISSSLL